jgi:hypothetical protein
LWAVITVQHSTGDEWVVSIDAGSKTRHRVRVSQKDIQRLAQGKSAEVLIRESFRFLLEREPNTSILSSFELPLIGQYFPEYEQEIKARLAHIA